MIVDITIVIIIGLNHGTIVIHQEEGRTGTHSSVVPVATLSSFLFAEVAFVLSVMTSTEPSAATVFTGLEIFEVFLFDTIPSGVSQQGEAETREDLVLNSGGSHHFVEKNGTFEVGTSRAGITIVLQGKTGDFVTVIIVSAEFDQFRGLQGKGLVALGIVVFFQNVFGFVGITLRVDELEVQLGGEAHHVEDFVEGHLGITNESIVSRLDVSKVEVDLTGEGTVGVGVEHTGGGPSDVALLRFILGGGKEDDISAQALAEVMGDGDFSAVLAGDGASGVLVGVDSQAGFVKHLGSGDHLIHEEVTNIS